ncbi:hypothetical protein N2152v2_009580 [Parachlorella kessleri]
MSTGIGPDWLQELRCLCSETEQNLKLVRKAGFTASKAAIRKPPPLILKENGTPHSEQLSADVAKLQLSQASLAASLQQLAGYCSGTATQLSQVQVTCSRMHESQGSKEEVGKLSGRVQELDNKLASALETLQRPGQAPVLDACMARIQALQAEQAALAANVKTKLAALDFAALSEEVRLQMETLRTQLGASQKEVEAGQMRQAASIQQIGSKVDGFAARLEVLGEASAAQARTAEALQALEEKLQELAANQQEQAAQLFSLKEQQLVVERSDSPADNGADARQEGADDERMAALQQGLDEMAQLVFDLRVQFQNNHEDAEILLASTKRQAGEAVEQAATATEQADSLAARTQDLEEQMQALQGQLAVLKQTVESMGQAAMPGDSQVPKGLADWLQTWLQEELKERQQEQQASLAASQVCSLEVATLQRGMENQAAELASLQDTLQALQAQQEQRQEGQPQRWETCKAELEGRLGKLEETAGSQAERAASEVKRQQGVYEALASVQGLLTGLEQRVAVASQQMTAREAEADRQQEQINQVQVGAEAAVTVQGPLQEVQRGMLEMTEGQNQLREQLARLQEQVAAWESSSARAGSSSENRGVAEEVASHIQELQQLLGGAQADWQQGTAGLETQMQNLRVRVSSLEASHQHAATLAEEGAYTSGQHAEPLAQLQQGLHVCSTRVEELGQALEGRVSRVEGTVAGALEEVASQMAALQAHVSRLEQAATASSEHAQQAAAAAALTAAQAHQLASAASQQGPHFGLGMEAGMLHASQQFGQVSRRSSHSTAYEQPLQERSSNSRQSMQRSGSQTGAPAELAGAAAVQDGVRRGSIDGQDWQDLHLPAAQSDNEEPVGEEKSLRELFGSGDSISLPSRRSTAKEAAAAGQVNLEEEIRQLEEALASSEVDDVQREILTSYLEQLQNQLRT